MTPLERTDRKNDWQIWFLMAGRGFGKTRAGAEDLAHFALWNAGSRCGVIAPTFADARDICIEGESGLLRVLPASCVLQWNRSMGELLLFNGSRSVEPVLLADAKEQARIDTTDDDALVTNLITGTRQWAEPLYRPRTFDRPAPDAHIFVQNDREMLEVLVAKGGTRRFFGKRLMIPGVNTLV